MSDHGHSALAARQNTRGETTNRATAARARGSAAQGQPAYLTQPIRSAAEAKVWLEAHAGAEVGDVNARWNIRWVDPNLGPSHLDHGARHMWLDTSNGAKSHIIEAAKATQTYLRDHPHGAPDQYQTTHEGLRRAVVARAQALERAAKADGRAADARAAHWLVEGARHNQSLDTPAGTRFFAEGPEAVKPGKAPETLDQLAARYRDQLHAMDLWKSENINPQAHLTPGQERRFNNERARGEQLLHDTETHARNRAESLKQLHEVLVHDQPAWASVRAGTDRDHIFDGQAKLLKQFDRGDYSMPKPTRAPKNETPEQEFARIGRDVHAAREWYGAVTSRPRSDANRGRDRSAPGQMTRQERNAYGKAYHELEGRYNGMRLMREHNALRASAEASTNDPFITALKEGKAVVTRGSDGKLNLYDTQRYDPHHLSSEGGTIYYRHDTGEEAIKPAGGFTQRYGPQVYHSTVGQLALGRYNAATDRHEGATGRNVLGVFDSRAKAVNFIKSQPEHLTTLFENARAHYTNVARNLADEQRYQADFERRGSTDNYGYRTTVARVNQLTKDLEAARRSVSAYERKMENAGLRPKAPRAPKATRKAG